MKTHFAVCRNIAAGIILIGLTGCSESTQKRPEPQTPTQLDVRPDEDVARKAPVMTDEQDAMAQKQLGFAGQYMEMARKRIMPYSQAVAICRDIIKNNPGSEYETAARRLLGEVPQDQRARYNITDQELGL